MATSYSGVANLTPRRLLSYAIPGKQSRDHGMRSLFEQLSDRSKQWRNQNYTHDEFPLLGEVMDWAGAPDGAGWQLRPPQVRALETYWYLRLVEKTPRIFDLYERYYPPTEAKADFLKALGIPDAAFQKANYDLPRLWKNLRSDDDFVREFRLEALRETLALDYPSYILALAMGAGKTALIGAVIATEFAMALEYPDGPFVQNALVFAPGTTILGSLRELAEVPYQRILPPRLYKAFAASVKLIFTRDGDKNIPVIRGSCFNVVVTNTEKIRIQKETIRKSDLGTLFNRQSEDDARAEVANLRLQAIASLPHLGVFSDEAHHTYGQALDTELKKVRKTVDYLHQKSPNLVCVVNTTGTPYFKRQPLRDVVIWYGLSQGIADGILKPVSGNIHAYSFDNSNADQFVGSVVEEFFKQYGAVSLPNGAPARLAIYFPQTDDLKELRPVIEAKLATLGQSPDLVLVNTSESSKAEIDAFDRLNDPAAPHRVILLVNKGTEGWNCPSLFACALARKLKTSNNFVLQAASRCLRQVPGNLHKAAIYLSMDNRKTLDRELQETYGESIAELNQTKSKSRSAIIRLRKINLPPLVIKQLIRTVVRKESDAAAFTLSRPAAQSGPRLERITFDIAAQSASRNLLKQIADTVEIEIQPDTLDAYAAAVELAAVYRLDVWMVHGELKRLYPGDADIPAQDLAELARQIEQQTCRYELREETVEVALALVKPDGFDRTLGADGTEIYTADISYPVDRQHLLLPFEEWREKWEGKSAGFGFHYEPYNLDSNSEKSFFEQLLESIGLHPDKVEDIYFTGALTDPRKTDFYVEYKDEDGKWHRYTPDFIIRRKDGKCLIVEIKGDQFEAATKEDLARFERGESPVTKEGWKAVAVRRWEKLNPDRLKYQMVFVNGDALAHNQTETSRQFVEGRD
jgi:type III restriction enzyme